MPGIHSLSMTNHQKSIRYPAPIRLAAFIASLLVLWLPIAAPIYWLVPDRNLVTILTMGLLFVGFLLLVRWWGQKFYGQTHLLKHYGLVNTQQSGWEWLTGLFSGLCLVLCLFGLEGVLGWALWQSPANLPRIIVEGLLSAIGIGFAEELVFRGWLLDELERDYPPPVALVTNGLLFAGLHFIKPLTEVLRTWPQFPGLLLLGLALVWAKRWRRGRLGLPMGLHAGLVWGYYIINVGQLIRYSGSVPDWVTGVDRNPLAGAFGLLFLSALAFWMYHASRVQNVTRSPTAKQ